MSEPRPVVVHPPEGGIWLSFHGIPVRIVATGEETGKGYCVNIGTVEPGGGAPPHAHSFGEGFYVLSGEMEFTAGNQTVSLGEGGFIHIGAEAAHFPTNRSEDPASLVTICVPAGFDAFQRETGIEVAGPEGPFPEVGEEDRVRMEQSGDRHGIRFSPDSTEFQSDPDLVVRQPGEGPSIAAVGDLYRFLVGSPETEGRYALWHATIFPGGGPPPHIHRREEEFFLVLSGTVSIYDDGNRVEAGPGTAVILPVGSRHWFKNESTDPAEMLIMVAPAGLEEMFRRTGKLVESESGRPGPPEAEEIERLHRIAPEYGIELG